MEENVEERIADLNAAIESAVVPDIAEFAKLVHKVADARTRRPNHGGKRFLADLRQNSIGAFSRHAAVLRHDEQGTSQALLARIEKLIHEVCFHARLARQQIGHEEIGEPAVTVEHLLYPAVVNADDMTIGCRGGAGELDFATGKPALSEEIAGHEDSDDGFLARFGIDREFYAALLDEVDRARRIALGKNHLTPAKMKWLSPSAVQSQVLAGAERTPLPLLRCSLPGHALLTPRKAILKREAALRSVQN